MKIFLFAGSRRGYAVAKKLLEAKAELVGILCLIDDPHEEQIHLKISALANEHHIPLFHTDKIKPSGYAQLIRDTQPDLAFAIGWRYLINEDAYSLPPKGTLIMHDSLLPQYRGFAPMNWALINGESKTGVTLFYIADGVDCGPIVDQMETSIELTDTALMLDAKIIKLYEDLIVKNLPLLASDRTQSRPQDESKASYCCKRTPEDGEINWNAPAKTIHNLIRGLGRPFPGAYTSLRGKRVLIWGTQLPDKAERYVGGVPGRVLGKRNGMIQVLTGDGVLQIKELEFEGEGAKLASEVTISVKDTFGR